mmetsp:Transcript_48081/g.112393  ORF Transcript_48081/g.112393 Transcript_48081/m.112393 type:complete len:442 (-) Transcript_48081:15-1340(-)
MGLSDDALVAPDTISQTLRCPICLDVFVDPVFCGGWPCQHVFCKTCILGALSASRQCPACREPASVAQFQPHQAINSLLDEIIVYCPHRSGGCSWTGRLDAQGGHSSTCAVGRLEEAERRSEEAQQLWRAADAELTAKTALVRRLQRELTEQHEKIDVGQGVLQSIQDSKASLESMLEEQREQSVRAEQIIARLRHNVQDLEFQLLQKDATIMRLESRLSSDSEVATGMSNLLSTAATPFTTFTPYTPLDFTTEGAVRPMSVLGQAQSADTTYARSSTLLESQRASHSAAAFPVDSPDTAACSAPAGMFHFTASAGSATPVTTMPASHLRQPSTSDEFSLFPGPVASGAPPIVVGSTAVGRSTAASIFPIVESPPSSDETACFALSRLGPSASAAAEEDDESPASLGRRIKNGTKYGTNLNGAPAPGRRIVKAKRRPGGAG